MTLNCKMQYGAQRSRLVWQRTTVLAHLSHCRALVRWHVRVSGADKWQYLSALRNAVQSSCSNASFYCAVTV
jgi:hypothetical protein